MRVPDTPPGLSDQRLRRGTSVFDYLARTHETALLTVREKQLIGLAVTMTRGCQVCTRGRIEKAGATGMEDELLNALVGVVSAVNAGVTAATAREAFHMADASKAESCGSLCSSEQLASTAKEPAPGR